MDYTVLSEQLVDKCVTRGADAAEVYIETTRRMNISLRNGVIETIQEAESHGAAFRVFRKGKMAFSYGNDLSELSLDNAIQRAIEFSRHTSADEHNVLPEDKRITDVGGLYDPSIPQIEMEMKIDLLKHVERFALKDHRVTKSAGARYNEQEKSVFLANSHGLLKNYQSSSCSFGVSVVAEHNEQKSSGSEYCTRRFFADLQSPQEVAREAAHKAYVMLNPRTVPTQRAPVIFDPNVAYAILGGILSAINGERVLQGASFLADKLDAKIGASLLTIIDDGIRPRGLGSAPFDGEGVPAQRQVIVENGILRNFMYNTAVAHRAGLNSTGNASRSNYMSLPGIGAHNFYIAAGEHTRRDMIRTIKNGLLLTGVTGYGIIPVNGHFSGGAEGLWIRNGRTRYSVKGITIASTAEEMLNGIDMVGDDLDLNRRIAAPTIRIQEMLIGGD